MNAATEKLVWLFDRLRLNYGVELSEKIISGFTKTRPVTLRINTLVIDPAAAKQCLLACGISFFSANWYSDALIIENAREGKLQCNPLYGRGGIYLQSLSSMLPPLYLSPQADENILDMTAAPGGKTTQMSVLSGGRAFITACERDKIRAERLRYNVEKQRAPRVSVLCGDAEKLDEFMKFDKILLDAPCSGSGTICLNGRVNISEKLVENSAKLQERLLSKALKLLKKGGTLVYSTCSVLPEENDRVVEKALKSGACELIPLEKFEGIEYLLSLDGTVCVCPNELYEGFYVAKLIKR